VIIAVAVKNQGNTTAVRMMAPRIEENMNIIGGYLE